MLSEENRPTSTMVDPTGWRGTVHLEIYIRCTLVPVVSASLLTRVDGNKLHPLITPDNLFSVALSMCVHWVSVVNLNLSSRIAARFV